MKLQNVYNPLTDTERITDTNNLLYVLLFAVIFSFVFL